LIIDKLKSAEVPERFWGRITLPVKRLILDNQELITNFLEKSSNLAIQFTDKKSGNEKATELAVAVFKIILENDLPIKVRLVYQFTPLLVNQIMDRQPITNIKNADIIIFDGFDIIDPYNAKLLTGLLGYRKNNGLKSIFISYEELRKLAEKNIVLQGLLNNYFVIKF